jgi:hypothetical protein
MSEHQNVNAHKAWLNAPHSKAGFAWTIIVERWFLLKKKNKNCCYQYKVATDLVG